MFRNHFQFILAAGLAVSLLTPCLSEAKPDSRSNCRLSSQEFVYVQLNMGHKIANLQGDLLRWNIRNDAVLSAMSNLTTAYDAVFKDAGKHGASHDTLQYSAAKLEDLRNAATAYYVAYRSNLNNDTTHLKDSYALQELSMLAVEEFYNQCHNSSKPGKNWVDKWNRIDNGGSAADVLGRQINAPVVQTTVTTTIPQAQAVYQAPQMAAPAPVVPGFHPGMQGPHPGHMPPPPVVEQPPMTESEFSSLMASVKNATFKDDKVKVIKMAIDSGNILTVDQTIRLMKNAMDFDRERVECAAIIYKTVYDTKNWYKVYDALDFKSSRDELDKKIKNVR